MHRVVRSMRSNAVNRHKRAGNHYNKAILIQITPEIYAMLKHRIQERNTTMRQWVTRAVIMGLKKEWETE